MVLPLKKHKLQRVSTPQVSVNAHHVSLDEEAVPAADAQTADDEEDHVFGTGLR